MPLEEPGLEKRSKMTQLFNLSQKPAPKPDQCDCPWFSSAVS